MNNLTVNQEANKPTMVSITMYDKDNFVNFSDSDSQTDYFNSYSLGINHLLDWIKEGRASPSSVVHVSVVNNEIEPKHIKRLERIAKAINYKIKTVEKTSDYGNYTEWYLYDADLIKESAIITQ
ncbi:MAG TPA: hypothetical protein VF220_01445 [Nitrososphaeraceae archaeon]